MIPSLADLRAALAAVEALADPLVAWEWSAAIMGAEPPPIDYHKVYVNVHGWRDENPLCVKRYFPGPTLAPPFTSGEVCRWHWAMPPWGSNHDLPPLALAVAMQRLPDEALPAPGSIVAYGGREGPCMYTGEGIRILDIEAPLWRVLQHIGALP